MKVLMLITLVAFDRGGMVSNAQVSGLMNSHIVTKEECEAAKQHEVFQQPKKGVNPLAVTCIPLEVKP